MEDLYHQYILVIANKLIVQVLQYPMMTWLLELQGAGIMLNLRALLSKAEPS